MGHPVEEVGVITFCYNVLSGGRCPIGWKVRTRAETDGSGLTVVSNTIACSGYLSQWTYQTETSDGFKAIVWRLVIGSATSFKIVGINDIPGGESGRPVTFEVPTNDRIRVWPGDMIGWSFQGRGLRWSSGGGFNVRWVGGHLHSSLQAGQTYNINGGSGYRMHTIGGTVETIEGESCKILFDMNAILFILFCFTL